MLFPIRQLNGGAPERLKGRPGRPDWSGFYQFWSTVPPQVRLPTVGGARLHAVAPACEPRQAPRRGCRGRPAQTRGRQGPPALRAEAADAGPRPNRGELIHLKKKK